MQTFKVGDWVVSAKYGIGIVESITNIEYPIQVKHFPGRDVYNNEELALWQPLPNEWCWFWNDANTLVLAQFAHGLSNGAKFTSKNLMYQYCEPFIGQLPTILQPQSKS